VAGETRATQGRGHYISRECINVGVLLGKTHKITSTIITFIHVLIVVCDLKTSLTLYSVLVVVYMYAERRSHLYGFDSRSAVVSSSSAGTIVVAIAFYFKAAYMVGVYYMYNLWISDI
jgi:hypothetical protein